MTVIGLDTIRERDIDLIIMHEFFSNRNFANLFTERINIGKDYTITDISHSVFVADLGESDIEITLSANNKKIVLLIENKIDAIEQPKQYERYIKRGDKKKENLEVDEYFVFMTAPKAYLSKGNKYAYKVSFEEMIAVIDNAFLKELTQKAIGKAISHSKGNLKTNIILAKVKDNNLFDKKFRYNYSNLDFSNLETYCTNSSPTSYEDAHRCLWDYIKQLRGEKTFKKEIPEEMRSYIDTNKRYNESDSQFINGKGYNDVAWINSGSDIWVFYREEVLKD